MLQLTGFQPLEKERNFGTACAERERNTKETQKDGNEIMKDRFLRQPMLAVKRHHVIIIIIIITIIRTYQNHQCCPGKGGLCGSCCLQMGWPAPPHSRLFMAIHACHKSLLSPACWQYGKIVRIISFAKGDLCQPNPRPSSLRPSMLAIKTSCHYHVRT